MYYLKKFLLLTIAGIFFLTTIIPKNVTASVIAQNFSLILEQANIHKQAAIINYNCLSDGTIVSGLSKHKQEIFITEFATALRKQNPDFSDKQIIEIIKTWAKTHKDFFDIDEQTNKNININTTDSQEKGINEEKQNKDKLNIEETVIKSKKNSIKGFLYRIKDSIKAKIQKSQEKINTPEHIKKNMQSNIKFFPFIQLMLGFELAEAFATIYITGSGYTLTFLSAITASLGIISFITSAATGFITSKISKRTIVVTSLIIHTLGSISLALVPYSAVFLVLSQILPAIGVAGLAVSLSPFFYSSMESLGEDKEIIKEKYSATDSIFSIVMALSSLAGGGLVVLFAHLGSGFEVMGQHIVVILAAALDVVVTIGAVFKTHKEAIETTIEDDDEETAAFREMKTDEKGFKALKSFIIKIFTPMKQIAKDKQTFAFVITNLLVNSAFFAVMTLLFQPVIKTLTANEQMLELYLAIIYFAANALQSISKKFALKLNPLLQRPITRVIFFTGMAALATGFLFTANPLFIISLFVAINFFYGTSSVSETMDVNDILPDKLRSQWLALKTIVGIVIATGVQAISTLFLSYNITESTIVGSASILVCILAMITSIVAVVDKIKSFGLKENIIKLLKNISNKMTKPYNFVLTKLKILSIIPFVRNEKKKNAIERISDDVNIDAMKAILACA